MTTDRARRLERSLPGLFDELADARTPDYLEAAIELASSSPQRPSWTFPTRWLPMDLVMTRVPTTRLPMRTLAILALVALLRLELGEDPVELIAVGDHGGAIERGGVVDRADLDLDDASSTLAGEIDAGVGHEALQPMVEGRRLA